ncbi:hypothetical protein A2U01_0109444, partial [Trifolium medium]|nr:hypothetical protein [Trifolium medium]
MPDRTPSSRWVVHAPRKKAKRQPLSSFVVRIATPDTRK